MAEINVAGGVLYCGKRVIRHGDQLLVTETGGERLLLFTETWTVSTPALAGERPEISEAPGPDRDARQVAEVLGCDARFR